MNDNQSHFASFHPVYVDAEATGGVHTAPAVKQTLSPQPPPVKQTLTSQSATQPEPDTGPLANDIYDNADIDLGTAPDEQQPDACSLADDTTGGNISDLMPGNKKNWLWLAGIAGGLFLIGRATK